MRAINEEDMIICFKDDRLFFLPVEFMPDGLRVNDCISFTVFLDVEKLHEAQQSVNQLIGSIGSMQPNSTAQLKREAYYNVIMHQFGELTRVGCDGFVLKNLSHAAETIAAALVGKGTK